MTLRNFLIHLEIPEAFCAPILQNIRIFADGSIPEAKLKAYLLSSDFQYDSEEIISDLAEAIKRCYSVDDFYVSIEKDDYEQPCLIIDLIP